MPYNRLLRIRNRSYGPYGCGFSRDTEPSPEGDLKRGGFLPRGPGVALGYGNVKPAPGGPRTFTRLQHRFDGGASRNVSFHRRPGRQRKIDTDQITGPMARRPGVRRRDLPRPGQHSPWRSRPRHSPRPPRPGHPSPQRDVPVYGRPGSTGGRSHPPGPAQGKAVLTDRYLLANVVYQGHAGGLDVAALWEIGRLATGGLMPDLTIVLDLLLRRGPAATASVGSNGAPGRVVPRARAAGISGRGRAVPGSIVVLDASTADRERSGSDPRPNRAQRIPPADTCPPRIISPNP